MNKAIKKPSSMGTPFEIAARATHAGIAELWTKTETLPGYSSWVIKASYLLLLCRILLDSSIV